ncbi:hypothetical protein GCM10010246_36350 [Streptomyces cuspidosporus]|uniref:Helix-turn-helix domain-containing protein n=1 Tax=Streptomyces cuspidosporus TaxID=66882 RepID=A0ABN3G944_9ACTN
MTAMNTTDPLLTGADIARLAGVKRPAVNNWQRRHQDFPTAVHSGGVACFPLSRVVAFLDSRVIPTRFLTEHELPGTTYGDRVRAAPPYPVENSTSYRSEGLSGSPAQADRIGPLQAAPEKARSQSP